MSIIVSILSTFNSKGLTAAEKRTKAFQKVVTGLGGTMAATFGARRITQFAKDSIKAFAEEDKAIRSLSLNLKALGLAYDVTPIEDYIDKLQRATGIADDQLRPAFQQLANATRSLSASQEILNVALDVSAGSGKSVQQVTQALSRAYLGNLTSLGRLNVGISKADLATKSFDDILADLSKRFSGQAAAAADTYTGKINRLKISADEAQEILGGKLVQAIEMLGEGRGGITAIADEMERFATYVGDIAVGFAQITKDVESLTGGTVKLEKTLRPSNLLAKGLTLFPGVRGLLKLAEARAAVTAPKPDGNIFKQLVKSLDTQKKITGELAKQNKAKAEASKLDKAKSLLDLEKIQIEAALQGDITENEKLRLQLMKAILNENADRATTLADKLNKSQEDLTKFKREAYDFKPENPFDAWLVAIEAMRKGLASIGAPVTAIPGAPNLGGALSVSPNIPEISVFGGAGFITPELATSNPTGMTQINLTVTANDFLSQEAKQAVVDAVVEASSAGYSTGWFRTTGRAIA